MKKKVNKLLQILPMLLIVGIMPLISYLKVDTLTLNTFLNWRGNANEVDVFSYYKSIFIIVMVTVALIFLLRKKYIIRKLPVYKYILIYMGCIIISVMLSDYKDIAIKGFVFRYEGMIMLLSYMLILFISINIFDDDFSVNKLILVLAISSGIVSIIGILQYVGFDIFQKEIIQKLIIPNKYNELVGNLNFSIEGSKKVYSTFTNSNYIGSYISLVFPVILTMSITAKKYKGLFASVSVLNVIVLVCSDSAVGIIAIVISVIVLFILLRKKLILEYKKQFIFIICIIFFMILMDFATNKVLFNKVESAINEIIYEWRIGTEKSKLEDIRIEDNKASIYFKQKVLNLELIDDKISFYNDTHDNLSIIYDENKGFWKFAQIAYKDVVIEFDTVENVNKNYMKIKIDDDISINLTTENNEFKYITYGGRVIENDDIKYWWGDGKEELFTSRVYIWSRILPIILEKPLFGYGPDTFAAVFPQYDYVGMYKAYDRTNMIVDKPHNMYIQITQSTGIISLIAFLCIIAGYFKDSFKIYLRDSNEFNCLGVAILVGIIGYLISGIANDSVIFIAPIFYCLLGVGVRINIEYM